MLKDIIIFLPTISYKNPTKTVIIRLKSNEVDINVFVVIPISELGTAK